MIILIADHDDKELHRVEELVKKRYADAELITVRSSLKALAAARKKTVDIAFLSADMPELSGLDLGKYLIELNPMVNLIYFAGAADDCFEAMTMHASGYLLRPVKDETVSRELDDLRHPAVQVNQKRVFAQTFGNFELFVDGNPVQFKYTRTKEVVAVLVNNRGAQTTNGEIIACLWEDDGDPEKKASYLANLRQDLQNTFTKLKLNGIILKQRGSMAIARDKIECDLFEWLDKRKQSRYQYLGDYMNQYSWPEYRHAELDEISYAMDDDE